MSEPFNPVYDVIVIGAGHAGCEAASAAARMGCRTLLLTTDLDKVAQMSCNPSIGGPAKSQLVREIDALGGIMGRVTDRTFIQIRMLNESKGPAVHAVRAQADKRFYSRVMKETLETIPNLSLRQALVERVMIFNPDEIEIPSNIPMPQSGEPLRFVVQTHIGQNYYTRALVVTTGTFLRGRLITGQTIWSGGRAGEPPSETLATDLSELGFPLVRLKTGTPPRIDAQTIDFEQTEIQHGSSIPLSFGHYYDGLDEPHHDSSNGINQVPPFICQNMPPAAAYPYATLHGWRSQLPCYMIYTSTQFHELVRENLHRAPLFSGIIEGVGPRYCPSIEDKIVRFADKDRHLLFLEPEGWSTNEVYLQGCNTSLPEDIQWEMLRSIPALRRVELMRIGYAIEYDAVASGEIRADLSTKRLDGLFLAGQINGTTGYEEAAAQGIMAGINAARFIQNQPSIILRRDEAYIGVLIDDLVTKEIREPYRMFTSRSEYRLLLRSDNADLRLTPIAYSLGLVSEARAAIVEQKREQSQILHNDIKKRRIFPTAETQNALSDIGITPFNNDATVEELLRRPGVHYHQMQAVLQLPEAPDYVQEQVELAVKYGGYIERQQREAERLRKMENRRIPDDMDYEQVKGLRSEARQLLQHFKPATLGQASRLAGVNPSDVLIVLFDLERRKPREKRDG